MVKIPIGEKPDLNYEQLMDILKKNLSYKMQMWEGIGDGVSIWKNNLIGAIVKIQQSPEGTILSVEMNPPSMVIRAICCIFGIVLGLIILLILSNGFAKKVAEEIKLIPELKAIS